MKRLSREYLELASGAMEKQKLSDEKFIVELCFGIYRRLFQR